MNAQDLLDLIPDSEGVGNNKRGRKRKRTGSSTAGDASAAGSSTAGDASAVDILALLPNALSSHQRAKRRLAINRVTGRQRARASGSDKQLLVNIRRFNSSGRAVTDDKIMKTQTQSGKPAKLKGKAQWKKWTPEASQRAAFSKGTVRQVAKDLSDGQNKYRPTTIAHCRSFVGKTTLMARQRGAENCRGEA